MPNYHHGFNDESIYRTWNLRVCWRTWPSKNRICYDKNNWDIAKHRAEIIKHNMPKWYLWCFDNHKPGEGKNVGIWARSIGACGEQNNFGQPGWPIDLRELKLTLTKLDELDLKRIVESDMETIKSRPYVLYGCGFACLNFYEVYQRANTRLAWAVFWDNVFSWINEARLIHQGSWKIKGPSWVESWYAGIRRLTGFHPRGVLPREIGTLRQLR